MVQSVFLGRWKGLWLRVHMLVMLNLPPGIRKAFLGCALRVHVRRHGS